VDPHHVKRFIEEGRIFLKTNPRFLAKKFF
jgi:hypothetical protein